MSILKYGDEDLSIEKEWEWLLSIFLKIKNFSGHSYTNASLRRKMATIMAATHLALRQKRRLKSTMLGFAQEALKYDGIWKSDAVAFQQPYHCHHSASRYLFLGLAGPCYGQTAHFMVSQHC